MQIDKWVKVDVAMVAHIRPRRIQRGTYRWFVVRVDVLDAPSVPIML